MYHADPEWRQAEAKAAAWMKAWGFKRVEITPGSGDGGVDVRATGAVAQVKYQQKPVGRPAIQQLKGAGHLHRQWLFFSWSGYSKAAIDFAEVSGVSLFAVVNGLPRAASTSAERLMAEVAARSKAAAAERERKRKEDARRRKQERRTAQSAAKAARAAERSSEKAARLASKAESTRTRRAQRSAARAAARSERNQQRQQQQDRRRRALLARRDARRQRAANQRAQHGVASIAATRRSLGLALVGLVIPIGVLSALALRDGFRAKRLLLSRGVTRSPTTLKAAAVLSVLGLMFAVMLVVSLIDEQTRADPEKLTNTAGCILLVAWIALPVISWRRWSRLGKATTQGA